jgi:hypothetical protein
LEFSAIRYFTKREVTPSQDRADDEGGQRDGVGIEQPVADAGIEERRGIVGGPVTKSRRFRAGQRNNGDGNLRIEMASLDHATR